MDTCDKGNKSSLRRNNMCKVPGKYHVRHEEIINIRTHIHATVAKYIWRSKTTDELMMFREWADIGVPRAMSKKRISRKMLRT